MSRDYKAFLDDILDAIGKIRSYTAGLTFEKFIEDSKTVDATIRNLEIIGEAVKNVPEEIRVKYPRVEWKRVAGLRDILIHVYFGIKLTIIWDVIQNLLPILERQVAQILGNE